MTGSLTGFELIIHIGSGKTGSTSIQQTLATNTEILETYKTRYLGLLGEGFAETFYTWQRQHGWLELLDLQEQAPEQLLACFNYSLPELVRLGYKRAIWSNEALFSCPDLILPVLSSLAEKGVKLNGIVYIRRHDAWARSAYLQWGIRHKSYKGKLKSFEEWSKDRNFSYMDKLESWLDTKDLKLNVRNYDALDNVVTDFLEFCQMDASAFSLLRANESPSDLALVMWAMFNGQYEEEVLPNSLMPLLAQGGLIDSVAEDILLTELLPKLEDLQTIREVYKKDRERLNVLFEQSGFDKMPEEDLEFKPISVSQGQINAALLQMLKAQNDKIRSLENRLNRFRQNS
ncbi:MAG: hypothetical protein KC422_13435 [Trueperaceae bacterium]|nr:hypothetical protein [Trueperaceae bacterium]